MAVELSESRRRIIMNSPHIVTPTAAGLHTFSTDMSAPLKECRVNFSPVQAGAGDPAPDNVRSISGWTGFNLTRCGKNLCPAATGTDIKKWDQIGGSTNAYYHDFTGFDPAQDFTLQATITELWTTVSTKRLYLIGDTNPHINPASSSVPVTKSITRKPDANGRLRIQHNKISLNNSDEYAASLTKIQLEKGSTATDYEPYNGVTIPLDWSSSAGTVYGGYVDLVRGVVAKEWVKLSLTTSNTTVRSTSAHTLYERTMRTYLDGWNHVYGAGLNCNVLLKSSTNNQFNSSAAAYQLPGSSNAIYWVHPGCATAEGAEALRTNQDIYFVYTLATPVTYSIDPVTLRTLRGLNNIWSDANGNIELSYWTH